MTGLVALILILGPLAIGLTLGAVLALYLYGRRP